MGGKWDIHKRQSEGNPKDVVYYGGASMRWQKKKCPSSIAISKIILNFAPQINTLKTQ